MLALESLDDASLWEVAQSALGPEPQEELSLLLERNSLGTMTASEKVRLSELQHHGDRVMLRKAYAYVLLKRRGHRLPTLAELEKQT